MDHPFIASEVLDRYLAGEATPAESARMNAWLEAHPHAAPALGALREVRGGEPLRADQRERLWRLIHAEMHAGARPAGAARRRWFRSGGPVMRTGIGLATAIVLVLVAPYVVEHFPAYANSAATVSRTYTTDMGERAIVTLDDGTQATLNAATAMTVVTAKDGARTVTLTGQALFNVTSRPDRPFIVLAGGTRSVVLGTEFSVRRYASDTAVAVAVRTGRVMVSNPATSHVLSAGRQADLATDQVIVRDTLSGAFSFARGKLTFAPTSLARAIPDMERWYSVTIRLADPALGDRTFHGSIRGARADDLADVLGTLFNVRVTRNGRVLTLTP